MIGIIAAEAAVIAVLVSGFLAYCLDYARHDELRRDWRALHDQVATLELRVRRMEAEREAE